MEGRNDTRQESRVPPAPLPLRFSDWSSLGSPHTRTSPHSVSDREVEQNVNIPNQLNVQSGTVPREETIRANSQEEVIVPPQINQQSEEQNVQMIEMEPNPLNIDVRTERDGIETNRESNVQITQPSGHVIPSIGLGEPMPILNVSTGSENNSDMLRGSHVRTQDLGLQEIPVIPPVDRLISITNRDRRVISENIGIGQNYPCEGTYPQGTSTLNRRDYLEDSSDDNRSYRGRKYPNERGRPLDEGRYPNRERRPPRRGGSQDNGRPQIDMEDPLMEEDPLMMEDHLIEMEDHQAILIKEDPQDLEDLLDQYGQ